MTETWLRRFRSLAVRAAKTPPKAIAIAAGVGIVLAVVFGVLQRTAYPLWSFANLDSEASAGTWFAAILLWAAAIAWVLVAITEQPRTWPVVGWSALLVVLALDEGNAFHESLERSLEVDWQILYLPVMALGGIMWLRVVMRHWPLPASKLLVGAAGVWAIALLLELVQNWGGEPVRASIYDPAMISEEGLEMIGSTLVLLAGLATLRRTIGAQ